MIPPTRAILLGDLPALAASLPKCLPDTQPRNEVAPVDFPLLWCEELLDATFALGPDLSYWYVEPFLPPSVDAMPSSSFLLLLIVYRASSL